MSRQSQIERNTSETQIKLDINLDGAGTHEISTDIGFLNHMLELFAAHGQFDLNVALTGDTQVDFHHSVEDIGICLGSAIKDALGDYKGIERYASISLPMDESIAHIALDISNRPCLVLNTEFPKSKVGEFDVELVEEFLNAFVNNAGFTLHVTIQGKNTHHMIEACFKGLARVIHKATRVDTSRGVPSTKGIL